MRFLKRFNLTNFSVYLYLTIFIYLFFYTFYRAEFIHSGNQFSYYFKYYLIFIFGILFWFFSSIFKKKNYKLLLLLQFYFFLLYFYETLIFFKPSILKLSIMKSINKETLIRSQLEEKTKYDVIQDLKKSKNIDVVPSISPTVFVEKKWINGGTDIFPLGGVSNTMTVFCKEDEEISIYKSDRYGFNNPDQEWDNEKVFWFLLGDSFVQGWCVQPGENFASQIRLLTKQSAISLGMSSNGPLLELASLKRIWLKNKNQK